MPKTGHFVLHSNVIPKLTAGRYDLVTDQTGIPFDVATEHTHVTVASPRYTMPTEQILSTFPPANAEGAFGDRLPQIVLKRRTLPWERNPAEQVATSAIPWLALVVVAEGEAQLSSATPVADCVTAGTPLLDADDKDVEQGLYLAVTETVVKKIFPCQEDLPLLVHVREVDINDTELANGDDDGWLAVVLANRLPVYDKANDRSVRYMACLVNIEGQLPALPPPEPPVDHFLFELAQDWTVLASIDPKVGPDPRVMGGISLGNVVLPAAGGLLDAGPAQGGPAAPAPVGTKAFNTPIVGASLNGASTMDERPVAQQWTSVTEKVAAAALDPDAKRLVRDTMASGFRYPIEIFAVEKVLRFPVLAHWSFTTNEGATFETLMHDLDVGLLGTARQPADVPEPDTAPEVVQTGHISLGHRSRRGDALRAWYRGPFVPFPTIREQASLLAHSADQIRRVVPDGREDLSLAAAFEIGRLLGLSQLSVVSALLRFRSEQFAVGRARETLSHVTGFVLPAFAGVRIDLQRFVAVKVIDGLVSNPDRMIGPQRPVADPGREIAVRGELDQVIADGLGIDLAAVRKVANQVGIVAALQRSAVPVADARPDATALRGALDRELASVMGVAAPQTAVGGIGSIGSTGGVGERTRTTRAEAPREPDALDTLIGRAGDLGVIDEEE
jgi:hypothetical protein